MWYIADSDWGSTQVRNTSVHRERRVVRIRSPADTVNRCNPEVRVKYTIVIQVEVVPLKHIARIRGVNQNERLGPESHCDTVREDHRRSRWIDSTRTIQTLPIDDCDRSICAEGLPADIHDVANHPKLARVTINRQEEGVRRNLCACGAQHLNELTSFRHAA